MLINIPLAIEGLDYLYPILEIIKDGRFISTKYTPRAVRMVKRPHVIVFANLEPDKTKFGKDRLVTVDLS